MKVITRNLEASSIKDLQINWLKNRFMKRIQSETISKVWIKDYRMQDHANYNQFKFVHNGLPVFVIRCKTLGNK